MFDKEVEKKKIVFPQNGNFLITDEQELIKTSDNHRLPPRGVLAVYMTRGRGSNILFCVEHLLAQYFLGVKRSVM